MTDYPATFDIAKPAKFERPAVFIRIIGYFILGIVNWLVIVLLPLYAAIRVASKKDKFLAEDGETIKGWLRSYVGLYAYVMVLTDKFDGVSDPSFRFDVTPGGTPTVGSALLRWITNIPHLLIVSALVSVSFIIWIIASVMIFFTGTYPDGLYDFNRGVVRWIARIAPYHGSLVGEYPPFAFDMGAAGGSAPAATPPSSPPA
ncbi:MAG TPA: DUF4389 domain-containing protein [Dehalococcoidia bacterium]|jgi:hypothetical protein|nr:DUF4389 domain-containing protein [Dehalococcoidia bacterium]